MKIIFAGTPEFAAVALAALHDAGHEITLVMTQPDRPAGRGMQLHASAVKQFAQNHAIPVAQPVSLRRDGRHPEEAIAAHALIQATPHDVMIVAAYGLILPPSVLAIPRLGCINIHASLLPRWRGAAPIHRAIEAGDTQTGITIMQMDQGLDTGPMLTMQAIPISPNDTTGSLHDRLAALGGHLIVDTLARLDALEPTAQPEAGVTYADKVRKEEGVLNFDLPAELLARRVRAFNPFPGATAQIDGTVIKFWQAHAILGTEGERDAAIPAGSVLAADAQHGILIACGEGTPAGVLRVTELQKPGARRMQDRDFIKGFALESRRFR
ncbi:MAG: methionyl-tRNA formyltransferase [Pseudomonadota bacterium]